MWWIAMPILNNIPPCKDSHRLWNNGAILVGLGTMLWKDGVSAVLIGISTWRSEAHLKLQERLVMQVFALPLFLAQFSHHQPDMFSNPFHSQPGFFDFEMAILRASLEFDSWRAPTLIIRTALKRGSRTRCRSSNYVLAPGSTRASNSRRYRISGKKF
jgi:hypothetical protein